MRTYRLNLDVHVRNRSCPDLLTMVADGDPCQEAHQFSLDAPDGCGCFVREHCVTANSISDALTQIAARFAANVEFDDRIGHLTVTLLAADISQDEARDTGAYNYTARIEDVPDPTALSVVVDSHGWRMPHRSYEFCELTFWAFDDNDAHHQLNEVLNGSHGRIAALRAS